MFSFLDMFAYLEKILHLSSHTYKLTEICITWKLLTTHKNDICERNIRKVQPSELICFYKKTSNVLFTLVSKKFEIDI